MNYSTDGQIGFGQTWSEYVHDCEELFAAIYDWTKDDGSLWLVADSFVDRRGYVARTPKGKPSALRMLPFELARIAERAGWTLREVVIWHKDRTLPWSGRGRMRNSFEYILLLVKTAEYKYHLGRLKGHKDLGKWWVRYPERYSPSGIAPDNVWDIPIPVQGSWRRSSLHHECPFPPDLVRRILLLSSDKGDWVFDPFAGSGTTIAVAEALERCALGVELNPTYVEEYYQTLRPYIFARWLEPVEEAGHPNQLARLIWHLRAVKVPRIVIKRLQDAYPDLPIPSLSAVLVEKGVDYKSAEIVAVDLVFLLPGSSEALRNEVSLAIKGLLQRRPLSKFGILGSVYVVDDEEFDRLTGRHRLFLYEHGHTWSATGRISSTAARKVSPSSRAGRHIPIVANVELSIRLPEND